MLALALAAGAPVGAAAGEPTASPGPDALLFRVSGAGTHFYLLGSVHVLRARDLPLPPSIDEAYADSEALVMELDLDDLAPGELERQLLEFGAAPTTRPLSVRLGDAWPRIGARLRENQLDPAALEGFDPWFVSTAIANAALARLGFRADLGVESQLERRAEADGKPISGLETVSEQLAVFEGLDEATQVRMLTETLAELDDLAAITTRTIEAWRAADASTLRAELLASFAGQQALYEALVTRRNARWVPALEALLATPATELVVVGALHLIGDDSVVALLRERDLMVEALW